MKNKIKTHKSLAKRIKISANNKWIRRSSNISHMASSKTKKQKKRLDQTHVVAKVDYKRLKQLIKKR